jgi:hypothetical protein
MKHKTIDQLMLVGGITFVLCCIFIVWYQAGVEAEVWNRCHPSQVQITQWEALWTNTRIDNCEV